MNIYIEDSKNFISNIEKIDENLSDGWQKPQESIVCESAVEQYFIYQYIGDKNRHVLLHINKEATFGKHIISISPTDGTSKLSIDEHNNILNHFKEIMKNTNIVFKEL